MKVGFTAKGWDDYLHWQAEDAKMAGRLNALIQECRRGPFTGSGQPEPLKYELKGWWSRRLSREHRLVYRVTGLGEEQRLEIAQCRFHY